MKQAHRSSSLAFRLAWRDLRGGLKGFRIFIACIALGVMAIVGVGSSARVLSESIAREGQRILGGDVALAHPPRSGCEPAGMVALAGAGIDHRHHAGREQAR